MRREAGDVGGHFHRRLVVAAVAVLAGGMTSAWADPVALRGATGGLAVVAAGTEGVSASAAVRGVPVQLAVDAGYTGRFGLSVGTRGELARTRDPRGPSRGATGGVFAPVTNPPPLPYPAWRVNAGVGGGLVVVPGAGRGVVGLSGTPWIGVGRSGGRWVAELRAVSPVAASLAGVRLPLSAELCAGGRIGRVWLAARGAGGAVWVPGLDVSLGADAGLVMSVWPRRALE